MTRKCVVSLLDDSRLECPAWPTPCRWVRRQHSDGSLLCHLDVWEIAYGSGPTLRALFCCADDYEWDEDELVLETTGGAQIRLPDDGSGSYLRVVSAAGDEQARWSDQQISARPEQTFAALMGLLAAIQPA